jgi:hypothetical protein
MNGPLAEIILAANNMDEENAFWITMLMLVVLGGVVGIISLARSRAKRFESQKQNRPEGGSRPYKHGSEQIRAVKDKYVEFFLKVAQPKTDSQELLFDFEAAGKVEADKQKKQRDLSSGMEVLDLDFLVKVVEKTRGKNKKNVTMRQLVFNELVRREKLDAIKSKTLNIYTINKGNVYSKNIQCEAMRELSKRTES